MAKQREQDLQRDQNDHDQLQRFHPLSARLVDEQVVDIADHVEFAADALLPLGEVEPAPGQVEDAREVLVADQFEVVVGPLEQARGLDFEFTDAPNGGVFGPPTRQAAGRRFRLCSVWIKR